MIVFFEIIENNVQEYATTGGHQMHKAVHFYDIIRILRLIRCDLQEEEGGKYGN